MHRRRLFLTFIALAIAPGAARAAHEAKKKAGGASYFQFPALTAVIIREDGRRGVLTVEAGVDVPDDTLRHKAQMVEPRLLDAYASSMAMYGADLRGGAVPNLDKLEARLQADTDRVLGGPGARVLLGTVLIN
jgi:hypothetical protein